MSQGRYHWSNCAPPARFIKINAIGCLPWLFLLLRASWSMFFFALVVTGVLVYIEIFLKMSLGAFGRRLIVMMTGKVKTTARLRRGR